jgi:copper chaperone CopZ
VCGLEAALVQRALEELDGIERLDITLAAPAGFV